MLKRFVIVFSIYMLAACSPAISPAGTATRTAAPVVTQTTPPEPTSMPTSQPSADQASNRYRPRAGDVDLRRAKAYVNSAQLSVRESGPATVELLLEGSLPTPCHKLRVDLHTPDAHGRIDVQVYSVADPHKMCIQVLADFSATVPVETYPAGQYTVWVNDTLAGSFTSP
jgi:hypothetical protein